MLKVRLILNRFAAHLSDYELKGGVIMDVINPEQVRCSRILQDSTLN